MCVCIYKHSSTLLKLFMLMEEIETTVRDNRVEKQLCLCILFHLTTLWRKEKVKDLWKELNEGKKRSLERERMVKKRKQ